MSGIHEASALRRHVAVGFCEKALRWLMLDNLAMMQEYNLLREPSRLADVMGNDDYFNAPVLGVDQQSLDGESRSRI